MRTVVTDGVVVRGQVAGQATGRSGATFTAHATTCRHASAACEPMATLVERLTVEHVRAKIAVGVIKPCAACQPTLLVEAGA